MTERQNLISTAADLLGGNRATADQLKVQERSIARWISGDRGISDGVLSDTAAALEAHADQCREHAARIRDHLKAPPNG